MGEGGGEEEGREGRGERGERREGRGETESGEERSQGGG